MFSGCPSVRPSVRPKHEIPSFDVYIGPLVHPTNLNRFTACPSVRLSVRPSGEVSGHLPENAWTEFHPVCIIPTEKTSRTPEADLLYVPKSPPSAYLSAHPIFVSELVLLPDT